MHIVICFDWKEMQIHRMCYAMDSVYSDNVGTKDSHYLHYLLSWKKARKDFLQLMGTTCMFILMVTESTDWRISHVYKLEKVRNP